MGTRSHPTVANQPFFVTATTARRRPLFGDPKAAQLLISEILWSRREMGFALLAYVIMPDHIHLIVVPTTGASLSVVMQGIKGRFARIWNERAGCKGTMWQPRFYESGVRTESQLVRWVEYIHNNPVEAGLARAAEDYPHSSASPDADTDIEAYMSGSWRGQAAARGQAEAWPSGGSTSGGSTP